MGKHDDPWWTFVGYKPGRKPTTTKAALEVHLRVLRRKVDESGRTHEAIRKRAGWRKAYLLEVLSGSRPLKLYELLVVLEAIGVAPGSYFEEVCRELAELDGN